MEHTPTPWGRNIKPASKYPTIFSGRNTHVAYVAVNDRLSGDEIEANLEFIVRACNAHHELIAAARQLILEATHYRDAKRGEQFLSDAIKTMQEVLAKAAN